MNTEFKADKPNQGLGNFNKEEMTSELKKQDFIVDKSQILLDNQPSNLIVDDVKAFKMHDRYVGENCVQLMVPYYETMTVFGSSKMLFHANGINGIDVNDYLYDERRKQFPYHDIPFHYKKKLFLGKILYVNQLFDFNKPYLLIRDGAVSQCNVFKTNDSAVVTQKLLKRENYVREFFDREDMYSFLRKLVTCDNGEQAYALDSMGRFLKFASSEERKVETNKFIDYLERHNIYYKYNGRDLEYGIVYDKSKIPNTMIPFDVPIFIVKINGSEIKLKVVVATFMDTDYYRAKIYDLPINKFTLEQISWLTKNASKTLKEPSISRRLNKNITKTMILNNKKAK